MTKTTLLSILLLTVCIACADKAEQPQNTGAAPTESKKLSVTPDATSFQKFINQFPELKLPVQITDCESIGALKLLDTTLGRQYRPEGSYIYGKITGKDYVGFLTLSAADCYLPVLTTYTNDGNLKNSKNLSIGRCTDGPCYKCTETVLIKEDFVIFVIDSMKTFNCDEDDLPIGKPVNTKVIIKKGSLMPNGEITVSKEIEIPVK